MENYILDGLRPLKRYLSLNQEQEYKDEGTEVDDGNIMDWGIDLDHDMHPNSLSSPTLINDFTNSFELYRADEDQDEEGEDGMNGLTPFNDDKFHDWGISPRKHKVKNGLKDLFQELVLLLHEQRLKKMKFLDEFRYTLVTSQLLDETILVSKFNQQRTKRSLINLNKKDGVCFKRMGKLVRMNSSYQISLSSSRDLWSLLKIRNLLNIISQHQQNYSIYQIRLVLIVSLIHIDALIRSNYIINQILQHKFITQLTKFIKSFQKIDMSLQKLITRYKEVKIYKNIMPNTSHIPNENPQQICDLITSSLNLLMNSITNSFLKILPFTNGIELENYCGIYHIELIDLGSEIEELKPFHNYINEDTLDQITSKFKKFQFLRRFMIVVMLATLSQPSMNTPFLNKIIGIFNVKRSIDCSDWEKLKLILESFDEVTSFCINLNKSIQNSIVFNSSKGVTPTTSISNDHSTDLLFNKIKEFELQLFLTRGSSDPSQLKELGHTLEKITSLYKKEITLAQNNNNILKIDKQRKRFSLPNSNPQLTSSSSSSQQRSKSTSYKNYKRLSTGLTLPLLTVMEEEEIKPKRAVSYDDNYLNIMPSHLTPVRPQPQEDQPQEDQSQNLQLQDYINERNLLSNDDSVIITNEQGEEAQQETLSNEEFRKKLEENFNRMIQGDKVIKEEDQEKIDENDEINLNNQKIGKLESQALMNELNDALKK